MKYEVTSKFRKNEIAVVSGIYAANANVNRQYKPNPTADDNRPKNETSIKAKSVVQSGKQLNQNTIGP